MQAILRALRLFGRERGLWKYALKPLAWGVLAYVLVIVLAAAVGERLGESLGGLLGASTAVGGTVGAIGGLALTIVLGGGIYLALVALIAGFGFDSLSREVEEREFGHAVGQPLGCAAGIGDSIARVILAGVLGLVGLCFGWTFVVPLLLAAILCLMDFTAPSLLRRGVSFGRQFGVARRLPGALPFALVSGVLLLIPIVNVLSLPILVAAGTILVAGAQTNS